MLIGLDRQGGLIEDGQVTVHLSGQAALPPRNLGENPNQQTFEKEIKKWKKEKERGKRERDERKRKKEISQRLLSPFHSFDISNVGGRGGLGMAF